MLNDKTILAAVGRAKGELRSAQQIADEAGIPPGEYKALGQRLRELTRAGSLEREGRRFRTAPPSTPPVVAKERPKRGKVPAAAEPPLVKQEAGATAAPQRTRQSPTDGGAKGSRGGDSMPAKKGGRISEPEPARRSTPGRGAKGERISAPEHAKRSRPDEGSQGERGPRPERFRGPRPHGDEIVGSLTLRPEGYGFVKRLEGPEGEDVFLPPHELRDAMDGDKVRVRVVKGKFGRDAGVLVGIISHRRRHFLGKLGQRGKTTFVEPVDPTLPRFIAVKPFPKARSGHVVKVAITSYADETGSLRGEIVKIVGEADDPIVEVLEVAYANGFAEEFPGDVLAEAEQIPDRVSAMERAGRRDLTQLNLVTIDGEDARDFDDAVCVERLPRGGYRLVVAIADVAHYVRPGTRLNEEAMARATSVYFPNHVLPMLPERLSNGICSLNPGVDRLTMVCDIAMDAQGKPVEAQLYEAVMNSHARCTYEQVAAVLSGETPHELAALEEDLLLAGELAQKLRQQRVARGALDFDLPEARAILGDNMLPTAIIRRERNDAHRLIEEFMLAANEAVARHFSDRDLPTIFRVHDQPDPEKLQRFAALAQAVGFFFDIEEGVPPAKLGEILRAIEGSPQERALNTMLLRSMMQAVYQPENIGHFGLAAEHYLHFTSPIRRGPDLLVHRLLKEIWARGGRTLRGAARHRQEEELEELAAHSSERERAAIDAEREVDQYFKCLFIEDRVGEAFDATVISLADFGFFAELDEVPVEGLVRAEELGTRWELDEARYRLVFPATGRSFGMGDRIRVEIAGVDLAKRQVSLAMIGEQAAAGAAPSSGSGRPAPSPLAAAVARRKAERPESMSRGRSDAGRPSSRGPSAGKSASKSSKPSKSAGAKKAPPRKQRPGRSEREKRRS